MNKDIKKVIAYAIPVVALGIGTFLKLDSGQTDSLETALNGLVTSVGVIWGVVGIYRSHHKK